MTNDKTKLLRLVGELSAPGLEGELLRQRFNRLPKSVMDDFELEPEARVALTSMDPKTIGSYIQQELLAWTFPPGEFPENDPKCYIPPPTLTVQAAYAMPNPQFKAVRPEQGPAGTQAFELTLYGEGMLDPVRLELVPQNTTLQTVTYDDQNAQFEREGTFRCGRIKVTCDLPSDPDDYDLKLVDVFGTQLVDEFEVPHLKVVFKVA